MARLGPPPRWRDIRTQAAGPICRWRLIGTSPAFNRVADADTLRRARRGDRKAIATLWRIYQPQLLRLLHARRALSPEDVASQVWIDVGRALGRFEGDGADFRRLLCTVARRRSIDEIRRAKRYDAAVEAATDWCVGPAADEAFDANASLERALSMVRRLSPLTAEAVMLRVVFDMPVSDVASIMDRSEGAVRVLVHRGLMRLRELLDEAPSGPPSSPTVGDLDADVTRGDAPALI